MENNLFEKQTLASTASGTLLVVFIQINSGEIIKTAVLAALGAFVSFVVSIFLKWCWKKVKGRLK